MKTVPEITTYANLTELILDDWPTLKLLNKENTVKLERLHIYALNGSSSELGESNPDELLENAFKHLEKVKFFSILEWKNIVRMPNNLNGCSVLENLWIQDCPSL